MQQTVSPFLPQAPGPRYDAPQFASRSLEPKGLMLNCKVRQVCEESFLDEVSRKSVDSRGVRDCGSHRSLLNRQFLLARLRRAFLQDSPTPGGSLRFAHRGLISFTPPACKPAARKGCSDISPLHRRTLKACEKIPVEQQAFSRCRTAPAYPSGFGSSAEPATEESVPFAGSTHPKQ